jgi:hypothetical protein
MYSFVNRVLNTTFVTIVVAVVGGMCSVLQAADSDQNQTIKGVVQNQDLRRVPQAIIEVKNQEGEIVSSGVSNDAGEFKISVPEDGTYSVSAVQETYRSEYIVLTMGEEPPKPVTLTLSQTKEVSLEVVSPLPPIQTKASSETYSFSRKEIDILPRGNNINLEDLLLTIPSAAYGSLKQLHIRQEHANIQFRIDGVPIPDTISSTFSDVITPRAWERADIVLGGMEANVGNRTAALIDITTKSGTKPGFGSLQMNGGSNNTINPSFEYGGTIGQKFRYYFLNSHFATNRGIEPPTLGHSIFHGQSERNQTMFRGDYQYDNNNNITLLFLNSIAKYQIPTSPGQDVNPTILGLLPGGFTPVPSEMVDENQKENNQYGHLVWRHDINTRNFFSLTGYFRQTRATFVTDPLNVLAYVPEIEEPFSAGSQDRTGYAGGMRLDYTYVHSKEHLIKAGFQIDRTQAINKTRLFTFLDDGAGNPTGGVINAGGDNRLVGWRQEFWIQDQWTPNEHWTFNLGVRADVLQYQRDEAQVSPRIGVTYRYNSANAFHAYYGRQFTPPHLERLALADLNLEGTKANPEDTTNNEPRAERAHYFQIGSVHALTDWATLQLTGYYKLANYMGDAHQLGSTPLLNHIAYERGWTRGADAALKVWFMENLTGRANIAWGQCKGYGLQSGHNVVHFEEIADINSPSGVHCDHQQTLTASGVLSYRLFDRTTFTGQVLFGSGLRTAEEGAKVNSSSMPDYTILNFSIAHVIPLPWHGQKLLLGVDIVNALDEAYFINVGEGSIGLGVSHAGMPRSFFFRGQWFF